MLDEAAEDAAEEELRTFIEGLNIYGQIELVALSRFGRGSLTRDAWAVAAREACRAHSQRTAEQFMGTPLLGDYLSDGLAEFGHTRDE